MIVCVTGDRNWTDKALVFEVLDWVSDHIGPVTQVVEGCYGDHKKEVCADHFAYLWGEEHELPPGHFPADWSHGPGGGPQRNARMLREAQPDVVIAFHDRLDQSRGTADCVHKAEKMGIQVIKITHKDVRRSLDQMR